MTVALPLTTASNRPSAAAQSDTPPDWGQVTTRIRNGDQQAFAIYYETFFDLVYHEVHRTVGRDEQTCLDIVQETFVKIIRRMKVIEDQPKLEAWTRIVARTTTWDWLRRAGRQQARQRRYAAIADPVNPPDDISRLADQARLAWVQGQLEQLPPELRRMIALRYRLGWSLARIGQHFGLTTGTVDGRLRRAIEQLKQQAEAEYHE